VHWSHPEKAPRALLAHNVHCVSLANNHTLDYGRDGFLQTREVLLRHGIEFFGGGLDAAEANRPFRHEVRLGEHTLRIAVFAAYEVRRRYLLEFDFYAGEATPGVSRLREAELGPRIAALKEHDPETFVVVYPHWGPNYHWHTPKQARTAHALIDAGADLIVGHGAHLMGEFERYRGVWIVYSLGNFMFNSRGRYAETKMPPYSFAGSLVFTETPLGISRRLRLYPILSDNDVTQFQPRLATAEEFNEVIGLLREKSVGDAAGQLGTDRDDIGGYIELELDSREQSPL
jgi:hypothetical protein